MRTKKALSPSLVIVLGAVVVIAVSVVLGDWGGDPGRPDRDGVLGVTMQDFRFEPAALFVPAGEPVTLVFVNDDDNVHTVAFGRIVEGESGRESGFVEDLLVDLDPVVVPHRAFFPTGDGHVAIRVEPGETVSLSVSFPEDRIGEWEMGCFDACGAHYRAGLDGSLTVEAPR